MEEKKQDKFLGVLKINKGSLNDELVQHPTYLYQYGLKVIKLRDIFDRLELKLDQRISVLSAQYRAKYKSLKNNLTETHIKDLVNSNEEIIKLKEEILDAKHTLNIAKLKQSALEDKGDKIVNYAHNIREELRATKTPKLKQKE